DPQAQAPHPGRRDIRGRSFGRVRDPALAQGRRTSLHDRRDRLPAVLDPSRRRGALPRRATDPRPRHPRGSAPEGARLCPAGPGLRAGGAASSSGGIVSDKQEKYTTAGVIRRALAEAPVLGQGLRLTLFLAMSGRAGRVITPMTLQRMGDGDRLSEAGRGTGAVAAQAGPALLAL